MNSKILGKNANKLSLYTVSRNLCLGFIEMMKGISFDVTLTSRESNGYLNMENVKRVKSSAARKKIESLSLIALFCLE